MSYVIPTHRRIPHLSRMPIVRGALRAAALLVIASAPLQAQDRADGDWHGVIATATGRLTMIVSIRESADGSRGGDLESIDQIATKPKALSRDAARRCSVSSRPAQASPHVKGSATRDKIRRAT